MICRWLVMVIVVSWAHVWGAGASFVKCCNSRGQCIYDAGDRWNDVFNGNRYNCICDSSGGSCQPESSSSGSSRSSGGGSYTAPAKSRPNYDKMLQYQMMQGLFEGFFQGMMQQMEREQREAQERAAEQQRQQAEAARIAREKRELEERLAKEKAAQGWSLRQQLDFLEKSHRDKKREEDAKALSQQIGGSDGLQMVPMGGSPFFGTGGSNMGGIEFAPMGEAKYDASSMSSLKRALCSAYLSGQAIGASDEKARYLNGQVDAIMSGGMYDAQCAIPPLAEPPVPTLKEQQQYKALETISNEIRQDFSAIAQMDAKIRQNREKAEAARQKKIEASVLVESIAAKGVKSETPEEKAELDALMAEAAALLNEATQDLAEAEKQDAELAQERERKERSLKEKSEQIKKISKQTFGGKQ